MYHTNLNILQSFIYKQFIYYSSIINRQLTNDDKEYIKLYNSSAYTLLQMLVENQLLTVYGIILL